MTSPVIHWFRRDLRLQDNTALNEAIRTGQPVLPLFILDDSILGSDQLGVPRLKLMLAALAALDDDLRDLNTRLVIRRGEPAHVLKKLIDEFDASALFFNADYTPLARRRDEAVVHALDVPVHQYDDVLIHAPGEIRTQTGTPYKVYTPFRRTWWDLPKPAVQRRVSGDFARLTAEQAGALPDLHDLKLSTSVDVPDARSVAARHRLDAFVEGPIFDYATGRDPLQIDPFQDVTSTTSGLSCYLRLGMLSPRQAWEAGYEAYKSSHGSNRDGAETWLGELAWRDFFTHILAEFPHVDHSAFYEAYEVLPYRRAADELEAWKEGQTGFPVVDAAMRQLKTLGWMHNRARMIVSSFMAKHLLLDWREGERHFMIWLIDGDPAVNNGNWQWAAGTGTDAQPFFRIFNPVSQSKKYDRQGDYIRHWVPELRDVPTAKIHEPWKLDPPPKGYPPPMVDLDAGRERALKAFDRVKQRKAELKSND